MADAFIPSLSGKGCCFIHAAPIFPHLVRSADAVGCGSAAAPFANATAPTIKAILIARPLTRVGVSIFDGALALFHAALVKAYLGPAHAVGPGFANFAPELRIRELDPELLRRGDDFVFVKGPGFFFMRSPFGKSRKSEARLTSVDADMDRPGDNWRGVPQR